MATIVISYRRDDSKWIAGRIYDRLQSHYGEGNVFMDIDSIPFGLDFRDHIRETLDRCDLLVAIIGPKWIGNDKENILDETDWVRIEIEAALNRKIPVIPVLIDQSQMPKPGELPDALKGFAFRQAARIDSEHFHSNMDKVIASIDKHFSKVGDQVIIKSTVSQNTETNVHEHPSPSIQTGLSALKMPERPQVVGAQTKHKSSISGAEVTAFMLFSLILVVTGIILINVATARLVVIIGGLMILGAISCIGALIARTVKAKSAKTIM
jgi:hypothetical protein